MSGKARSGKNTAAEVILREYTGIPFAFADDIKKIAYKHFGWHRENIVTGKQIGRAHG